MKTKLDFLNREIKFKNLEEFQIFERVFQVIKNDELPKYNQLLHRMRLITTEFEV